MPTGKLVPLKGDDGKPVLKETKVLSTSRGGKMNITILGCNFCHACAHAFQHKPRKLDGEGKCNAMKEKLAQMGRRTRE